jgi:hypothetical protein
MSTRRNYYVVSTPFQSAARSGERRESPHTLSMILVALLVVVIVAVASDELIATWVARELITLWSDLVALGARLASGRVL